MKTTSKTLSIQDLTYFVKEQNEIMKSIVYINGVTPEDLVGYADAQKYFINNLKLKYALLQQKITENELMTCNDGDENIITVISDMVDMKLPEELRLTLMEESVAGDSQVTTDIVEQIHKFHNYCKSSDVDDNQVTIEDNGAIPKDKPYCCRCKKVLRDTKEFIMHMSQNHPKGKRHHHIRDPLQCEVCGRLFVYERVLQLHMKSHSDEVFFVCEICGASFKSEHSLKKHLSSHQNERMFLCALCPKRFNTKDILGIHTYMVHQPERWRHKCPVCDKKFSLKTNMIAHSRRHKETQQKKPKEVASKRSIKKES